MARNFSPLAGNRRLELGYYISGGKKLRRYMPRQGGRVVGMLFHHIVGDVNNLQAELLKTHRTLSVNYGIARNGDIYGCVAEFYKANTSSHQADHSHITVETANETLAPNYKISAASFDAAARLAADCGHAHGFVPSVSTIRWHREFYPTECPGPDFWGRRNEFITLARAYYYGRNTTPTPAPKPAPVEEDTMSAAEVQEIKDYVKAQVDQAMEIIRRESRPRLYKYPDGRVLLARVDTGMVRGPYRDIEHLRASLPINAEHLVTAQEEERAFKVTEAEANKIIAEADATREAIAAAFGANP